MALLLAVCLCALAVHLYAESLGAFSLSLEISLAESGGHFDDHFLPVSFEIAALVLLLTLTVPAGRLYRIKTGLSPLLPPPNR
jgi:hypothetical protein